MKKILSAVLSVSLLIFTGCSVKKSEPAINEETINKILKENNLPYTAVSSEQSESIFPEADEDYVFRLAKSDDATDKIYKMFVGYKNGVCDGIYIETLLKTAGMDEINRITDFACDLLDIGSEGALQVVNYEIPTALNDPYFVPDGKMDLNFRSYNYHFSFRFLPAENDVNDYSAENIRLQGVLVTAEYSTMERLTENGTAG